MFVIESDATIVVPLVLTALLECRKHPAEAKALLATSATSFTPVTAGARAP